jgi:Protein of unknown function (DUF4232)
MFDPDDRVDSWLGQHQVEPLSPAAGAYDRIARTALRRRTVRTTAAVAAVAVVVAGVSGVGYRIATAPHRPLPPAASTSPSLVPPTVIPSPGPASPSAGPSTPPSSPAGSANSPTTQPARCHTHDLKVTAQGAPGGGAAGSEYDWLIFTNASSHTCTLYGFPGVSWVSGPSGQQVNDPAQRTTTLKPTIITLAPGNTAHAQLQYGHPQAFEPDCHTVDVTGFRVYPPDETTSVFVPFASKTCSTPGIDVGHVDPISTGQ